MKKLFSRTVKFIKAHPKLDIVVLILGLAIFATIALFNAPRASLWFDEAFSAYISQFNFLDIARYTASDVHPPLYYWLLKIWTDFFGTSNLGYRSLSVLFGAGAITSAFFLTKKLFGRMVSWTALLFLVISPMLIRYSDEARMYTLAALIVLLATQALVKATEAKKKRWWVLYGILVSLGMWTHYFTAMAWLAHWVWRLTQTWRKSATFKANWKAFFSKEWVLAYAIAVGLFLPWLPFMAYQLGVVQGGGFWIGPVGIDTPANYFTNTFYYLDHGPTQGWLAVILVGVLVTIGLMALRAYRALARTERKWLILVTCLAFVPPLLLFLASLPPLRSSFVERYMMPAIIVFSIFMAVSLVVGTRRWRPLFRALPIVAVVGMMIFGITNVYYYGNFNKNTNTHIFSQQVAEEIQKVSKPGEPIVASTPWVFYEITPYATANHPVWFIDANTQYIYGSLNMLKDNDMHKIKDIDAFKKANPVIWYFGNTADADIPPYQSSWQKIQTVGVQDPITGDTLYKATEYRVNN
ncbi:MAG TPA: glycosyltransferase family 39 protein [Dongiaceae bacterium]|nr:glycosyltransferase family 39 protein [Dongiaceae bacterium]